MRARIDERLINEIDEVKRAVQILTGQRCSQEKASKIYVQLRKGSRSSFIKKIMEVLG